MKQWDLLPGSHRGTLSCGQVSAAHLKIGHPRILFMSARSSYGLQGLHIKIGPWDSSPSDDGQDDIPNTIGSVTMLVLATGHQVSFILGAGGHIQQRDWLCEIVIKTFCIEYILWRILTTKFIFDFANMLTRFTVEEVLIKNYELLNMFIQYVLEQG